MWKKFGTLLCASAMVLTLAGCGSSEQPEEDNTFVVGMECAYAPFNWQSSNQTDSSVQLESGGYADGYDVMIAKNIADQLGKELVIKQVSWDSLIPALGTGDIDAVIAGMTANEEREQAADFTTPYYDSQGMIMIVRKDSEEAGYTDIQQFSGKNVVGQNGTNYDEVIEAIDKVLEQGHICLQETLVDSLAQQLLNNPLVQAVVVRSEKTKAYPDVKSASVEIFRVCHD